MTYNIYLIDGIGVRRIDAIRAVVREGNWSKDAAAVMLETGAGVLTRNGLVRQCVQASHKRVPAPQHNRY